MTEGSKHYEKQSKSPKPLTDNEINKMLITPSQCHILRQVPIIFVR